VLAFCATLHGLPRAAALTERLGLTGDLDELAVNYSLGMRKKLALVAAMLHEPELLILDGPTNGLDPLVTRAPLDLDDAGRAPRRGAGAHAAGTERSRRKNEGIVKARRRPRAGD